jgi:ThiF family
MMRIVLELTEEVYGALSRHLLSTPGGNEEAAFVLARQEVRNGVNTLRCVECSPVPPEGFTSRSPFHFELADETRAAVIKRAHDLGASIVEFHSHTGPWPPKFSPSDWAGFEEFVPHVWWRLKGRPYSAVVVSPLGFDAFVWLTAPDAPARLDAILADERVLEPSGLSPLEKEVMTNDRFDRHMPLFGETGQQKLGAARVALIGVGGLGTHVVQQLALLGVKHLALVDSEDLADTDRNRYVTARHDDPVPGTRKVDLGERTAKAIAQEIKIDKIADSLMSVEGFAAVIAADYVFGCLDSEGARLVLTELCSAYSRPYFDLASDVVPGDPPNYGGRICVTWEGDGCLVCRGLLDLAEAQVDLADPAARRDHDALYGIKREALGRSGPSVVSINGAVASLGVTEFMAAVTGLRRPKPVLMYYGHMGRLTSPIDAPTPNCYYCNVVRGQGAAADVHRYLRADIGTFLR